MILFHRRKEGKTLLFAITLNLMCVSASEIKIYNEEELKLFKDEPNTLQFNRQVTVEISESQRYYFENRDTYDANLTLVLTPCASNVTWALYQYQIKNDSSNEIYDSAEGRKVGEGTTSQSRLVTVKAMKGRYSLVLSPQEKTARITIYLTMDTGGPLEMTYSNHSNITLVSIRPHWLSVTWNKRALNTRDTNYCLVVSKKKKFLELCSAEEEVPEGSMKKNMFHKSIMKDLRGNHWKDPKIICVQNKRKVMLKNMVKNETYYFSLFAINSNTNYTLLYGHKDYIYKLEPIILKEGERRKLNLKKYNGKKLLKFMAKGKKKEIFFYVLVCGGAVNLQYTTREKRKKIDWSNYNITFVDSYKKLVLKAPGEYIFNISAPDVDERNRLQYVEVFYTTDSSKYPLPAVPDDLTLHEYADQRKCQKLRISWRIEPDTADREYCVIVWENGDLADKFKSSFQCHLNYNRTKPRKNDGIQRGPKFSTISEEQPVHWNCTTIESSKQLRNSTTGTYVIPNLKPGKNYTIQVTVKKRKGRKLSYKLLKAETRKKYCKSKYSSFSIAHETKGSNLLDPTKQTSLNRFHRVLEDRMKISRGPTQWNR